jgi:hypothetical protein
VLLVPKQIVVQEQLAREPGDQRRVGIHEQLPVGAEIVQSAHRLRDSVAVRTALGQVK